MSTAVAIPVRDGVTLVADVYLPEEAVSSGARVPAILERTPYDRQRPELQAMARFFAGRGYAVVLQDCRGRFDSGGDFSFSVNSSEHLDGYDTVEWIAQQAWSAGRVGTTGLSFAGSTQQALAVMRPPHLTTQVILDAGYNYWDRLVRHGGAFAEGVHLPYALWMAASGHEARADPIVRAALLDALAHIDEWIRRRPLRRGSSPLTLAPTYEAWYFAIAEGADYDARWRNPQASLDEYIDRYPDIPLCLVTSWYGHHAGANLTKFRTLAARNRSPVKLVIGPWVHGFRYMEQTWAGEIDLGQQAALRLHDFQLDWFDRWLRPADSPPPSDGHSVDFFVMGGGEGHMLATSRLAHGGSWDRTNRWPPADLTDATLYLHADGSLRTTAPEAVESTTRYTYDPSDPVPTVGGSVQDPLGGEVGIMFGGGFDQRGRPDLILCSDSLPLAARPDVLVFQTEPLAEPVDLLGSPKCYLWASSSAVDTDFTLKLVDVYPPHPDYPAGFALNLCDTIVRARYRNGRRTGELIEGGKVYLFELDLPPVCNRFNRGHRIRLDVSSSSAPQFDVNPNTGEPLGSARGFVRARNAVSHSADCPSHLVLPVRST